MAHKLGVLVLWFLTACTTLALVEHVHRPSGDEGKNGQPPRPAPRPAPPPPPPPPPPNLGT